MQRAVLAVLTLPLVATGWIAGCSESELPYELAPARGRLTFPDGTVPTGDIAVVRFVPDGIKKRGKFAAPTATGDIQKDGSFELTTHGEPGAVIGKYKVVITIVANYPADPRTQPPVVDPAYTDEMTTPLSAEVLSGDKAPFFLVVKKP